MKISDVQWNEFLEILKDEFLRLKATGIPFSHAQKAAKEVAYECYPDIREVFRAAMKDVGTPAAIEGHRLASAMSGFWTQLRDNDKATPPVITALPLPIAPKPPSTPPATNGDRQKPGIVLYPSGYSRVNETVLVMVRAAAPTPGKIFCIGNLAALNALVGCSSWAISNVLLGKAGNTTMHDAGSEFEPVERSTSSCYEVRCIRAPRTAADIEADSIRAEMAAMAAKQKELETRLRGLGL